MAARFNNYLPGVLRQRERCPTRSIFDVLSRMLPKDIFEGALLEAQSKFEMASCIARRLGVREEALLLEVAAKMGIPYIEFVAPIDLLALPQSIGIETLRRECAIPIIKDKKMAGLICADPGSANQIPGAEAMGPLHLSSSKAIRSALEGSAPSAAVVVSLDAERKFLDAAKKAIALVASEADKYSASEFYIRFDAREIEYFFFVDDGKRAVGSIHQTLERSLRRVLVQGVEKGEVQFEGEKEISEPRLLAVESVNESTYLMRLKNREESTESAFPLPLRERDAAPPAAPAPASVVNENQVIQESAGITTGTVLVIDDNETFCGVLDRYLKRRGLKVTIASDGKAAQKLLSCGFIPDLIICDVHMPGVNGIEILAWVKEQVPLKAIPVIMLTSDTEIEMEIRLLTAGAEAFVGKDKDPRVLCAHVLRLIERRRAA